MVVVAILCRFLNSIPLCSAITYLPSTLNFPRSLTLFGLIIPFFRIPRVGFFLSPRLFFSKINTIPPAPYFCIDPPLNTKLTIKLKMVTRKRKQEAIEEEELQALPSDESEEEEE